MRLTNFDDPSSSPERCRARLDVLRPYMPTDSVGAELGVFKGSFVDYLLETGPKKLYLVDPWFRDFKAWKWAAGDQSTLNAYMAILEAFRPEIESKVIEPRVEFSQDFLASLPDSHLDWVYIDTVHTYEQTKIELDLAMRKVKRSGYIIGDDYNSSPQAYHKGVYQAVQEYRDNGFLDLLVDEREHQFVAQIRSY
jgi:hypothetical protein